MAPMHPLRRATSGDWIAIRALLETAQLPLEGAQEHIGNFLVAVNGNAIVACAGFEDYGGSILLRSVAVAPASRGSGTGAAIVAAVLDAARQCGARYAVLLTTTAADYFARRGFRVISREQAPEAVQQSAEFRGACPASATVMMLDLNASSHTPHN